MNKSKIFLLLTILGIAIYINAKYNAWYYRSKILSIIDEQSVINKDLYQSLNDIKQTTEYVEFSLDVNNKLLEEVLMEQIKRKGD